MESRPFITCLVIGLGLTLTSLAPADRAHGAGSGTTEFDIAFAFHRKGNLPVALEHYNNVIAADSTAAMAYQMRAIIMQQQKQYQRALDDYTRVIATGENAFKVVGYYNRGIVKNMTGDFGGAIIDFTRAIELNKKMGAAYFHRGIAKARTGDPDGHLADFRQAALYGEVQAEKWLSTYHPDWRTMPPPPTPAPLSHVSDDKQPAPDTGKTTDGG